MTYSLRTIATMVANLKQDIKDLWNAFFDISESKESSIEQIERQGVARAIFWLWEILTTPLFAAMVIAMDQQGYALWIIFLAAWTFDLVDAFLVSGQEHWSQMDITIGKDFRRLFQELEKKQRWLARVLLVPYLVWSLLWNGPAQVAAFFHLRQTSWRWWVIFLALASGVQSFFWMHMWTLGYEVIETQFSIQGVILVVTGLYVIALRRYFAKGGFGLDG